LDEEHSSERLLFGYFILSCRRKSDWLEGIQVKTIMDDGAKRALNERINKTPLISSSPKK
jgi:hypothetical protein